MESDRYTTSANKIVPAELGGIKEVMELSHAEADPRKLVRRVLNLANLIEYQPGAVVSRALIDKETGTVTLFAFEEGEGLSEHTAPFDALVHVIDGEAEVTISGERFRVKEGEMIIMPANEPHALRAPQRFKMLLVMVRGQR